MDKWFRLVGRLEGTSFLVLLLVAMPLKYYAAYPVLVQILGPVHGVLFLAYCAIMLFYAMDNSWTIRLQIVAFLAAVVPFGTFWFERAYLMPNSKRAA